MSKPSLLPCGCEDGTCDQCKAILELDEVIRKTSVIRRNAAGEVVSIISTRTEMEYRRIMKQARRERNLK